MAFPVVSVKMPAELAGASNGRLPADLIVPVGSVDHPKANGQRDAVNAFKALAAEVHSRFGLHLDLTSTADGYRRYAVQESTFLSRYTRTVLAGRPSKVWNGVRWYQKPGTAMSAVPGTSNHGWGLAFDTCYRGGKSITSRMDCFNWMLLNAFRFGFSWEAQSEPWHIRYYAGDQTPQAVLDYLKPPPTVVPAPPDEGDDDVAKPVFILTQPGTERYYVVFDDHTKRPLPSIHAKAALDDNRRRNGQDELPLVKLGPEAVGGTEFWEITGPVLGAIPFEGADTWGLVR